MKRDKSLIINLLSGPGVGKSVMATRVFSALKDQGIVAEMALEFAKDLTWEGRHNALTCQPYVLGEQIWRVDRLIHAGVEIIITDSPVLLSLAYSKEFEHLPGLALEYHRKLWALNFFLERVKPYSAAGRNQTESEAKVLDDRIEDILVQNRIHYVDVPGDQRGADEIVLRALEAWRAKNPKR